MFPTFLWKLLLPFLWILFSVKFLQKKKEFILALEILKKHFNYLQTSLVHLHYRFLKAMPNKEIINIMKLQCQTKYLKKIKKSIKIEQDKKSLISIFASFACFSCYCRSLICGGETGRWAALILSTLIWDSLNIS